jgi:hypothetical protein
MPALPSTLRGRNLVALEAAFIGDRREGERLLAPLRALRPEIDTFSMVPPDALGALHVDSPAPVPVVGDGILLRELPSAAIENLLDVAGAATDSPLLSVDIRHLGGMLGRPRADGGAVSWIDGQFALSAVGIALGRDAHDRVAYHLDAAQSAVRRWATRRLCLNFAERAALADDLFGVQVHGRLRAVKSAYDPDDVIQANHPVLPDDDLSGLRSRPGRGHLRVIDERRNP